MNKPKPRLETLEQQEVVRELRKTDIHFFAVPNGSNKSVSARAKFQREGLVPGVPDIMITTPSPLKNKPVAVEMKRVKNHRDGCTCLEDEQIEWHKKLIQDGWIVIIAHGAEEAIKDLKELGYELN